MKHVLVVDDNLAILKQIAIQLSNSYRVFMAKSGQQALAVATQSPPDIILLDVEMPGMDGFATIAALRHNPALAHVPVIFLTAHQDTDTQVKALQAGGVDFIKKPFEQGVLLHRMELQLNLSQYQRDLENTIRDMENNILLSFTEIVESRGDGYSRGHAHRTREYIAILGRFVREKGLFPDELDEYALDLITRAVGVHDVGEVGISDMIILKPGRFTEAEYAEVKKHALIGAKTLSAINQRTPSPMLRYAIDIAAGHHERYDGSGYPKGLRGDDIPLCARLASVVNVYDSLLSPAVFRPPYSHDAACAIIKKGVGTEFDPLIATVFLENHEAFAKIPREYPSYRHTDDTEKTEAASGL